MNVLARTPSKLSSLSTEYPNLLHVIQGDIRDLPSIKQTLTFDNRLVDIVISSIGMVFQRKGLKFVGADRTICQDGIKNINTALSELEATIDQAHSDSSSVPDPSISRPPPKLIVVSSTGISSQRDIPLAVFPLYHYGLAIPHDDKKKMEALVISSRWPWVIVRPSLLFDGPAKGLGAVRSGTEIPSQKDKTKHAIGYTIRREDVGLWIFEECVSGSGNWEDWVGKCVSLTY